MQAYKTTYKSSQTIEEQTARREAQDKAAKDRDVAALVKLVEGTVRRVAKKYSRGPGDLEDLCAAGRLGAVLAARDYDVEDVRGASFNTFAQFRIEEQIVEQAFFFWGGGEVRKTASTRRFFFRHGKVFRALPGASMEVLAEALGVSAVIFESVKAARTQRADADLVQAVDDKIEDPVEVLSGVEEVARLRAAVAKLSERSRYVIEERFFKGRKLREIKEDLGLTGERVRQIEVEAKAKLRRILESSL